MHVVITGGAGFLGTYLVYRLMERRVLRDVDGAEREIESITVLDPAVTSLAVPPVAADIPLHLRTGSVCDAPLLRSLLDHPVVSVFHLATLLPGVTERDLGAALQVNVDGARTVLEALRSQTEKAKFVSASTVALFGRNDGAPIRDGEPFSPTSIYGLTKAISEQFAEAYRIGAGLDVRGVRFPTVIVRPRSVASSAGSALSDILREVSLGNDTVLRVRRDTAVLVSDYQTCIDGMIRLHDANADQVESNRFVNFSGIEVTVDEMIEAAQRAARQAGRLPGKVTVDHSAFLQATMDNWPTRVDAVQARSLDVPATPDLGVICQRFLNDYAAFWRDAV